MTVRCQLFRRFAAHLDNQAKRAPHLGEGARSSVEYGESAEAQSFIAKYEWHDVVGAGSYSSVHRAFEKRTGRPVAIKVIKKEILTPDVEAQIINEAVW